jgi:uncharacterized lipoprotein YbaY
VNTVRRLSVILPLFAVLLSAGCRSVPPAAEALPSVVGTITLREPGRLPDGAVLEIRLVDFTQARSPAVVVERADSNPGQPPLRFRVAYDPVSIDPQRDYSLEARIVIGGRPRWVQVQPVPVITKGRPVLVEVLLQTAPNGL